MDNPQIEYYGNGNIWCESWKVNDKLHRLNGPARIYNYENGKIESKSWHENGQTHRLDGPADIYYHKNGNIKSEYWWINGKQIAPLYKDYPLTEEQQIEMKLTYG